LDSLAQTSDDARIPDLEEIFTECFGLVWSSLRRLGVAPGDLDDATQEVFVIVHRRRASIGAAPVRPWLYGIVRRIASRYRRGDARRGRLTSAIAMVDTENPTLDDDATQREAIAMVETFVAALDDDKREVFVLAELEQLSGKEIAAALGIRADTVWSRLRAAREAFDRHFTKVRAELVRASGSRAQLESRDALALSRRAKAPAEGTRRRVAAALAVRIASAPAIVKPVWWAALSTQTWVVAGTVAVGTVALVGARETMAPTHERGATTITTSDEPAPAIPAAPPIVADGLPPVPMTLTPITTTVEAPPPRTAIAVPAPAPSPPAATSTLAAELALLERARKADPTRALALAEAHAQQYPQGKLAADGLAIRVAALCELGRDANAVAAMLAAMEPTSPWAHGCPKENSTKPAGPGDDPG